MQKTESETCIATVTQGVGQNHQLQSIINLFQRDVNHLLFISVDYYWCSSGH